MYRTPTTSGAAAKNTTPSPAAPSAPTLDAAKTFIRRPDRKRRSIDNMDTYRRQQEDYAKHSNDHLLQEVMKTFENIPLKVQEYPQMRKDIKAYLEEKSDRGLRFMFELSKRTKEMEAELEMLRAALPRKDSIPASTPGLEKIINERFAKVEHAISEGLAGLETKVVTYVEEPLKDLYKHVQLLDPAHINGIHSKIEDASDRLEHCINRESKDIQAGYQTHSKEVSQELLKIGEDAKRMWQGVQDLSTTKQTGLQPDAPVTYASVAAAKPGRRPALHSVAITFEDNLETADEVLARVKVAVDAGGTGLKINKVRKAKNQTIILGCDTEAELTKVKEKIESRGKGLIVAPMKNKDPLVVLKDVFIDNEDDELIKALYSQNEEVFEDLSQEEIDVKIKYKKRTRNPKTAHVVMQVKPIVWQRMTEAGALYLNLQRVRVEDQSPLIQCTKCLAFGHGRKFCTESVDKCSHCGGPHLRETCADFLAQNPPQCCNCSHSGLRKTDHNAFSVECPVRQKWDYLARANTTYA